MDTHTSLLSTYALSKLWDRVCLRRVALISFSSSPCVFVLHEVMVPRTRRGGAFGAELLLLLRVTRTVAGLVILTSSSCSWDSIRAGSTASGSSVDPLLLLSLELSALLLLLLAESWEVAVLSFKLMLLTWNR